MISPGAAAPERGGPLRRAAGERGAGADMSMYHIMIITIIRQLIIIIMIQYTMI